MKKEYTEPKIEVFKYESMDVCTDSPNAQQTGFIYDVTADPWTPRT